jgi:hypothetical protein
MKTVAIRLLVAFEVGSAVAFAQGASDPVEHLRACSLLETQERLDCLEKLSRAIAPPTRPSTTGENNWIVSETSSPVDYTPIVTARTSSSNGSMQLSIHCRSSRTELAVMGPAVLGKGTDYAISYRVNDGQPVQLAAGSPSSGTGAAFTGDVVRLLQSLPEEGDIAVRLTSRTGAAQEGHFLLGGVKMVREKVAVACKWPQAVARPRN